MFVNESKHTFHVGVFLAKCRRTGRSVTIMTENLIRDVGIIARKAAHSLIHFL